MSDKETGEDPEKKVWKPTARQRAWRNFFFDRTAKDSKGNRTFLQRVPSARASGYKDTRCNLLQMGKKNYQLFTNEINEIMGDVLSPEKVYAKTADLMEAEKIQYFTDKGKVIDERTTTDNATQVKATQLAADILKMKTLEVAVKTPDEDSLNVMIQLPPNGRDAK